MVSVSQHHGGFHFGENNKKNLIIIKAVMIYFTEACALNTLSSLYESATGLQRGTGLTKLTVAIHSKLRVSLFNYLCLLLEYRENET